MSHQTPATDRPLTTALAEAAATAGHAPSVHNTQPWRWRVLPDALELRVVRDRQLTAADPEGRLLALSCGAALHHARVALAAEGWTAVVERLPDPQQPDLLARLTGLSRSGADPDAMRLVQCMQVRHTDRRPVSDEPVPAEAIDDITRAADDEGSRLQILDADQVMELAATASHAGTVEAEDPQTREELQYWTHRAGTGTGLPPEVLPQGQPQTTVPARDFGSPGNLPVGPGHDKAAVYGLLYGDEDEPDSWLRAGEALSALWLTATRLRGVGGAAVRRGRGARHPADAAATAQWARLPVPGAADRARGPGTRRPAAHPAVARRAGGGHLRGPRPAGLTASCRAVTGR